MTDWRAAVEQKENSVHRIKRSIFSKLLKSHMTVNANDFMKLWHFLLKIWITDFSLATSTLKFIEIILQVVFPLLQLYKLDVFFFNFCAFYFCYILWWIKFRATRIFLSFNLTNNFFLLFHHAWLWSLFWVNHKSGQFIYCCFCNVFFFFITKMNLSFCVSVFLRVFRVLILVRKVLYFLV